MKRLIVLVAFLVLLAGFLLSNTADTSASPTDTNIPDSEVASQCKYFIFGFSDDTLTHLELGQADPIAVSDTCAWEMPSWLEPYDLGLLSDDLENLPEYQDGGSAEEEEAIEQICLLTKSNDPEVKKGLSLIEKYGVPKPTIFGNSEGIPNYNSQLEVLLWLAQNDTIDKDYGRVALGLSLVYGSVVTIGDEEVDVKVRDYVSQLYSYIKDTDKVLEQKGLSWRGRDYPLEAIIGLVWGANNLRYPYFYEHEGDPQGKPSQHYWRNEFKDRQMNSEDFNWLFVSPNSLREMSEWAFNEHFVNSDISETANRLDTKLGSCQYYMTDRPDVPPSYFEVEGKITPGCRISNPDWQWEYFKDKGKIVGNCEDVCFADSIFLKSLNMAPFGGLVESEEGTYGRFSHCVILYYAPQNHSLRTTARQLDIIEGRAEGLITYRISRLPWDNFCDEDIYAFEVISSDKKLLETGIDIQEALSMPEDDDNPAVEVGLESILGKLVIAYGYKAGEGVGGWTVYNPEWAVAHPEWNTLTTLYVGRGYWLNVAEGCDLTYGANTYELDAGWNLVGWLEW